MGCCSSSSAAQVAQAAERGPPPTQPPLGTVIPDDPGGLAKQPADPLDEAASDLVKASAASDGGRVQAGIQQAREALRACRARLDLGDIPGAESELVMALRQLQAEKRYQAIECVRASSEYAETVEGARIMEGAAKDALGSDDDKAAGEWQVAGDVKVDFKALGVQLSEEAAKVLLPEGTLFKIYYRHNGKNVDVRVRGMLASMPGPEISSIASLAAMYHETSLWHTWHPVIVGKGPTELWKRRPCHNLWHVCTRLLMRSDCELMQERMHFLEKQGVFMMTLDSSPTDPTWDKYPAPSGYKKLMVSNRTRMVMIPQEHTTFFSAVMGVEGDRYIPGFLVKFVVAWAVPEAVRRMLKAGSAACGNNGPHEPFTSADAEGVYGMARRTVARGRDIDALENRKLFKPADMPTADIILGRDTSIFAWQEAFLREAPIAPVEDIPELAPDEVKPLRPIFSEEVASSERDGLGAIDASGIDLLLPDATVNSETSRMEGADGDASKKGGCAGCAWC